MSTTLTTDITDFQMLLKDFYMVLLISKAEESSIDLATCTVK